MSDMPGQPADQTPFVTGSNAGPGAAIAIAINIDRSVRAELAARARLLELTPADRVGQRVVAGERMMMAGI